MKIKRQVIYNFIVQLSGKSRRVKATKSYKTFKVLNIQLITNAVYRSWELNNESEFYHNKSSEMKSISNSASRCI